MPSHEPWHFSANGEDGFILSENGVKILITYINDLKVWGQNGWSAVGYFNEQVDEIDKLREQK